MLAESAHRIGKRTLLVLDLSDIAEPYADKIEHIVALRDGSEGTIADGHWPAYVVGVENADNAIVPL